MLLYMVFYYRKLSVVIIAQPRRLGSHRLHAWRRSCRTRGTTRSRSPAPPGIIVSVGVTVDTYVVFFERIRDETASWSIDGQRRAAQLRGRPGRTILAADFVVAAGGDRPVLAERRLGQGLRPLPRAHDGVRPAGVLLRHPPGDVPAGADAMVVQPKRPKPARRRRSERRHERQRRTPTTEPPTPRTVRRHPSSAPGGVAWSSRRRRSTSSGRRVGRHHHLGDPDPADRCSRSGRVASTSASTSRAASRGTCPPRTASRSTTPRTCSRTTASAPKAPGSRSASPTPATFIKVQVGDQPAEVGEPMRAGFAEAAGVDADEVNVNLVSSTWGTRSPRRRSGRW